MNKLYRRWIGLTALTLLTGAATVQADDFFTVTATGSSGTTVGVGGSNLINLSNDLVNQQKQFSTLSGQNVSASLSYGGVNNAIHYTENASQTAATITFPSTGFTKTFVVTPGSPSLDTQISNYLKQNGDNAYAQFLASIDRTSAVAAVDGNPHAATAFIATDAFNRFGWEATLPTDPLQGINDGQIRADGTAGVIRTDGLNSDYYDLSIENTWRFNEHVGLTLATAGQYTLLGNSSAYTIAEELGLPITLFDLLNAQGKQALSWQVTPWAFAGLVASYDQVAGAVLAGGGVTSSLAYNISDFTFVLGDQIGYDGDIPVSVDTYQFEVPVDQWIVKNGGRAIWHPFHAPVFIDGGVAYSDFLHPAAIRDYWTFTGGIGFNFTDYSGIRVGYEGDFAKGYNASGGMITLFLSY